MGRRRLWLGLASAAAAAAVLTTTFVLLPPPKNDTVSTVAAGSVTPPPTPEAPAPALPSPTTSTSAAPVTLTETERVKLTEDVTAAVGTASPRTTLGFTVYDRETGETLASANADTPLYTASVVKLLIAIDVLHDDGWITPDAGTVDDLTDMLAGSNDSVASAFWDDDGGIAIVRRMADLIGLDNTNWPTDPDEWGMTKTSANDVVAIYQFIEDKMPDDASATIMKALGAARNPADDGFVQYFGIPDAFTSVPWAVKQGWMELKNALVLNTTGVVGADARYVVVLLTQQPASIGWTNGRAAVTAGMTAAAAALKNAIASS
jgi:hypothetical protein